VANRYSVASHHYLITCSINYNFERKIIMSQIIYLVGLVVVIMAILSFLGLA